MPRPPYVRSTVAAALLLGGLVGCSSDSEGSPPAVAAPSAGVTSAPAPSIAPSTAASAAPSAPTSAVPSAVPSADHDVVVTVTDGEVEAPGRVEVRTGESVRLTVTSDVDEELHVHGVDLEEALPAGTPTTVEFRPDESGQFEVELHESGLLLFQLLVR